MGSQVCSYMSEGSSFRCNVSGRDYDINSEFNCDSSGVVHLLGCKVCGKQCVGSTFASFRARFNNYKSSSRKFSSGVAVTQAELFRHFTEANHHGLLADVSFQIIDRVFVVSRHKEGFWQFRLQSFMSDELNVRHEDHYQSPMHFPSINCFFCPFCVYPASILLFFILLALFASPYMFCIILLFFLLHSFVPPHKMDS